MQKNANNNSKTRLKIASVLYTRVNKTVSSTVYTLIMVSSLGQERMRISKSFEKKCGKNHATNISYSAQ
jgi:hypothetical protein